MAKTFPHINTTVDINDKQRLTFVELEVRYPKDNELVAEMLDKCFKTKIHIDADDRAIWRMNLRTDEKKVLQTILKSLEELDIQYASRTETVQALMSLLK